MVPNNHEERGRVGSSRFYGGEGLLERVRFRGVRENELPDGDPPPFSEGLVGEVGGEQLLRSKLDLIFNSLRENG